MMFCFLHQIFKFVPFLSNIEGSKALHRFFEFASVHNEWREVLFSFPGPIRLDLSWEEVDEAVLRHAVSKLSTITELDLSNNRKLSAAGLQHLVNLTALQQLNLSYTNIGDEGLQHIANLSSIQQLHISDTKISDVGLKNLANLQNLKTLYMSLNKVTNDGLQHLSNLVSLEVLGLSSTNISDSGLQHLVNLVKLETIELHHVNVSANGLQHLVNLPLLNPEKMSVKYARVSEKVLTDFKKQLLENQKKQQTENE